MRFRKLRIAWSVGWGVLCLLLIVWWANSNISVDKFALPVNQATYFKFLSLPNEFAIGLDDSGLSSGTWHGHIPTDDWLHDYFMYCGNPWSATPSFFVEDEFVIFPHWFGVLLSATFTVAPLMLNLRWRFSLRTLLIATTLVAVVLGLVVAVIRWPAG